MSRDSQLWRCTALCVLEVRARSCDQASFLRHQHLGPAANSGYQINISLHLYFLGSVPRRIFQDCSLRLRCLCPVLSCPGLRFGTALRIFTLYFHCECGLSLRELSNHAQAPQILRAWRALAKAPGDALGNTRRPTLVVHGGERGRRCSAERVCVSRCSVQRVCGTASAGRGRLHAPLASGIASSSARPLHARATAALPRGAGRALRRGHCGGASGTLC